MCISLSPSKKDANEKSPLSPWKRFVTQPIKPKLSRFVVKSARVNLNRYWSKFEEMAASRMPLTTTTDVDDLSGTCCNNDNDVNENILNTLKENGK